MRLHRLKVSIVDKSTCEHRSVGWRSSATVKTLLVNFAFDNQVGLRSGGLESSLQGITGTVEIIDEAIVSVVTRCHSQGSHWVHERSAVNDVSIERVSVDDDLGLRLKTIFIVAILVAQIRTPRR